MTIQERISHFDQERAETLRRIWFVGDVHGEFNHLARTLQAAKERPRWIVFAGDIDIAHKPFREILEPVYRFDQEIRVAFIHGNHDADSHDHWEMLHDCGPAAPLHGQVVNLSGVLVAGLGGHFIERVWMPPGHPKFASKQASMNRGGFQYRDGQRPKALYHGAIYPDDLDSLARKRADILVTHEAPSCHPHGFDALDGLARDMQVMRTFHGHHHDDLTSQYATPREQLGFAAVGLRFCQIKNGLGVEIFEGERNL
jgi:hypothetical protein